MTRTFRSGALGALMDEYERAAGDLMQLVESVADSDFEIIRDRQTQDEDCRSIQTIMSHVVRSGYGYANRARAELSIPVEHYTPKMLTRRESLEGLQKMLVFTAATLDGRWHLTDDEIVSVKMQSGRVPENLEQLLEHAIVHVLRHRRQIERFLLEKRFSPYN